MKLTILLVLGRFSLALVIIIGFHVLPVQGEWYVPFGSDFAIDLQRLDMPIETRLIAQEQQTHLLDLNAASIAYAEAIGPDAAHRLNRLPDDNTRK